MGPMGPSWGAGLKGPKQILLAVSGPGRHPRSFPEPVGTILRNRRPKQTHMDPFDAMFDVFALM